MVRFVRINLAAQRIDFEEVPPRYSLLSGRGLTSQIIADEVEPSCDALGEQNKVVIAPGLFAGTRLPNSSRVSIGAKSPLTGGIKESNGGGTVARKLAKLGVKAIILEGRPMDKRLRVLRVAKDEVSLESAQELVGLGNYETMRRLRERYGSRAAFLSIGQAGEMQLSSASIAISDLDGLPNRHCGRGGLGAVLGSKGIKAIVVDDTGADEKLVEIADIHDFNAIAREWAGRLLESGKGLRAFGTASLVDPISAVGGLPTWNFRAGAFDGAQKINGRALTEACNAHGGRVGHACSPGCVIRCSNVYHNASGDYVVSALEYETIGLMGSNLGIDDLSVIALLNRKCNDYGIDTMETGVAIGVAMEAGLADFGDGQAALRLVDEIGSGTRLGQILGSGATATGREYGVERVPAVKGQGMSAYDPRALKGTGTTYATSPQGADHTAGNGLPGRLGVDPNRKDDQVRVSRDLQIMTAVLDGLGLCLFVGPLPPTMEILVEVMSRFLGRSVSMGELLDRGKDLIRVERNFNWAAGFTRAHDRLPEFFRREALKPKELVFDVSDDELDEVLNF